MVTEVAAAVAAVAVREVEDERAVTAKAMVCVGRPRALTRIHVASPHTRSMGSYLIGVLLCRGWRACRGGGLVGGRVWRP